MPAEDITLYAIWEKDTGSKLPQTGINIYLTAGIGALVARASLILLTKARKKAINNKPIIQDDFIFKSTFNQID